MEVFCHEIAFRPGRPGCCWLGRDDPAQVTSGKPTVGGDAATGFGQPLKEIEA